MRIESIVAGAVILVGLGPGVVDAQQQYSQVSAGAAKVVITPPVDPTTGEPRYLNGDYVWMAGYSPGREATGVHDDLYARALVLDAGETRIAVVALDVVGFMLHDVQDCRYLLPEELGIDHLIVASTHNHEGPDAIGIWGHFDLTYPFYHLGADLLYMEELKLAVVAAVEGAVENLREAGLRPVRASTAGLGLIHDSRDPIIIDEQVNVLYAEDRQGDAVFTLVNWANHPEALGEENTQITADFPKWVCDEVEESLGGVAVYTSGALGGLLAPNVPEHSFEAAEDLGRTVGREVVRAVRSSRRLLRTGRFEYAVDEEVDIFLFNPLFRLLNFMAETQRRDRELVNCGPFGLFCLDLRTEINYVAFDTRAGGRIFDFITVPGEIVPELWYDLQQAMHGQLSFMIGLGNDELGYILPLRRYECSPENPRDCWETTEKDYMWPLNPLFPGEHYEETMSVGPEAGPVITAALRDLITVNRPGQAREEAGGAGPRGPEE